MTGHAGDDEARQLAGSLAAELRRLYERAGGSPDALAAATKKNRELDPELQEIPRTTMNDVLRGIRARPPARGWITSFVIACIVIAQERKIDLGEGGTVGYWHRRHDRTMAALADTAPYPVIPPPRVAQEAERTVAGVMAGRQGAAVGVAAEPVPAVGRQVREAGQDSPEEIMRASLLTFAGRPWWQEYSAVVPDWFAPYLTLEPSAEIIRVYEPTYVPGLLQTESYAREVIRLGRPEAPEAELRRRVELRMRRQEILGRPNAPRLWAVIDKHAFYLPDLSRATVQAQIKHLTEISGPDIIIQLAESQADMETVSAPVTLLRFPHFQYPDIAYLEQPDGAIYPGMADDVDHYCQVLERLAVSAATPDATSAALREMLA